MISKFIALAVLFVSACNAQASNLIADKAKLLADQASRSDLSPATTKNVEGMLDLAMYHMNGAAPVAQKERLQCAKDLVKILDQVTVVKVCRRADKNAISCLMAVKSKTSQEFLMALCDADPDRQSNIYGSPSLGIPSSAGSVQVAQCFDKALEAFVDKPNDALSLCFRHGTLELGYCAVEAKKTISLNSNVINLCRP